MKRMTALLIMIWAGLMFGAQPLEVGQLKQDLVGHTMGGREKCWKFQSADQIKKLEIRKHTGDTKTRMCTVVLELQARGATDKYRAEARVEYAKKGTEWKIKHVGLLSLEKAK